MIFFFLPLVLILSFYFIGNIFTLRLNSNSYEKPVFGLGLVIILTNYFYFNLNLTLQIVSFILLLLFFFSFIITLLINKNYLKDLLLLSGSIVLLLLLFVLLTIIYGEQFYVFRGNGHDHFAYLSSGLMFNNYSFEELLSINKIHTDQNSVEYIKNLKDNFYLGNSINIIQSRPSAQLMLGLFMNLDFLDITKLGFIFKSLVSAIVLLSLVSFFKIFSSSNKLNLFISYSFLLSFFYFYNYEIDAYSLILSLPFLFLILKYSFGLVENTINFQSSFYFKYIFLWTSYFIIYPNGAAIILLPVFIYVLLSLLKYKISFSKIGKIFLFAILFVILILPTYKTTIMYLYSSEIPVGLNQKMDFWGYYGAFILGKDNPIHNYEVILKIKELWSSNSSIFAILSSVFSVNLENQNHFFVLNIIPSTLGMFHFSTSNIYGQFNYLLALFLLIINFIFIKTIFLNIKILFKSKNEFYILFKTFLIYFTLFFLYLIFNTQFWPAIKLYFVFSPIFFILISFKFRENKYPISKNYIMVLLMLLPIYKYSEFNHGIGRLDSFPSIIKQENKKLINWTTLDKEKLLKCKDIKYDLSGKFEKIYVSLIYNKKINGTEDNKTINCKVELINNNFIISKLS